LKLIVLYCTSSVYFTLLRNSTSRCKVQRTDHVPSDRPRAFCGLCPTVPAIIHARCADKSLARQERKQATATKLWIHSTYSPRSSIRFLAHYSYLLQAIQKKFRWLSVQPGLRGSNDLRVGRNMVTCQLFFQSREQVVVRRGQIR